MGWENMFEEFDKANKKAANPFANMFGDQPAVETPKETPAVKCAWDTLSEQSLGKKTKVQPKPELVVAKTNWDAISEQPKVEPKPAVAVATDWGNLNEVLMTPFERDIRSFAPDCNISLVSKWVKSWELMFEQMSTASETMSHEMLNLTQDLSRVHESQAHMFSTIQNGIREVDLAFNPEQPTGLLAWMKSAEPKPLTNDEVNDVVNKVQAELAQLKVKIDPFITNGLVQLSKDVAYQFRELDAASVALEYKIKFDKCEQEFYDRQVIRLHNIRTILSLSDAGVTQLNKQIQSRTSQLGDFKLQAVPMVVIKLQQYIINKDASKLKGAFVDILEMKLE